MEKSDELKALESAELFCTQASIASGIGKKTQKARADFLVRQFEQLGRELRAAIDKAAGTVPEAIVTDEGLDCPTCGSPVQFGHYALERFECRCVRENMAYGESGLELVVINSTMPGDGSDTEDDHLWCAECGARRAMPPSIRTTTFAD